MSYIETHLMHGEGVHHHGHLSFYSLMPQIIVGCIVLATTIGLLLAPSSDVINQLLTPVTVLLGIVGIVIVMTAIGRYYTTEIAITNKRVIAKTGFVKRDTIEMLLTKVESLQVEQGIVGRITDFGTIVISGAGEFNARIPGIASPMHFRKHYYEELDREKQERTDISGEMQITDRESGSEQ